MPEWFSNPEFWKYVSIPVVAGVVGWFTNLVAIKLLFYPVEPFGKPPYLGWQGILPSKAAKMGAITADTTLSKLGTLRDVYQTMDPDRITEHLMATIEPKVEAYVEWVMLEENPRLWKTTPDLIKRQVFRSVRQELPGAIERMMAKIGDSIEEMVDIKDVVVNQLIKEKKIVNKIFLECGRVEFDFIIKSGFYFGVFFGLIQMVFWYFLPAWWVLPLFGILVGYLTNWIAIRIIFQPLNPRKIGPFTVQGLFLKRQKAVAEIWCGIVAREIITLSNIIEEMLYGRLSENTHGVIRHYIRKVIDRATGITRPMIEFSVGVEEYRHIKDLATEKAVTFTAYSFSDPEFTEDRARLVQAVMQDRMEALSSEEFQHLLRPAFQEDELKLILLGAVLGLLAGLAQLFFVFGG